MKYLMFVLAITITIFNSSYGFQKSVSLSGGLTTFSDHYDTGVNLIGKAQLRSHNGLSIDLVSGYIRANGKDNNPKLHMAPILGGVTYTHSRPFSMVEPYIGVLLGASLMSGAYDSPLVTYGGKIGTDLRMDGALSVFLEAQYLTLKDSKSKTDLSISPLTISMGVKLNLGQDRKKARVGKQVRHRRKSKRYQLPRFKRR